MLKKFKWPTVDRPYLVLNIGGNIVHKMFILANIAFGIYILINIFLPINFERFGTVVTILNSTIAVALFGGILLRLLFITNFISFDYVMLGRYTVWYSVFMLSVMGVVYRTVLLIYL